ncbi:adenylosuccinate lyase, partial [Candidatus Microgenomates bacterium]|nr:adenylosuccinate lyase [Candidatus Microgenomates bacterium]
LNVLISDLKNLSDKYKKIPMLARTHGQPALGTTLGKELAVFSFRLDRIKKTLHGFRFQGKLNGAVGNYSAMFFAYPKIDWIKQNSKFVENLGLEFNPLTTQIESGDSHCEFFQKVELINTVLVGLCQDFWRYISDGYFKLANNPHEVGSSTMPQKINPIHFENAEGNLLIANSLLNLFITRLPISRLQRDLSGSTIRRNYGVALGHTLLAYHSFLTGLKEIKPAETKMMQDLRSDWSILSEAVQIYLKSKGYTYGYETVKKLFRGLNLNEKQYKMAIENLPINSEDKKILKKLRPEEYLGLSDYLADYQKE